LIADRHVVGVTTNPTIFASAVAKGDRYNDQLRQLAESGAGLDDAVFAITTTDVRSGCDVLRPVHERTGGVDGRVSIEVDPRLAHNTTATVDQARALWRAVDRQNLFIKIPATPEGLEAITAVVGEGISVNVTLIFSLDRYRRVMDAYLAGVERAASAGHDLSTIHSVASFFISRVDSEIDAQLDAVGTTEALALKGKAGIANARLAYQAHEDVVGGDRWQRLRALGAHVQRPLWASTGVKDPAYPDTMYVTELITRGTVNTMPGTTLAAFADHGVVSGDTVRDGYPAALAHIQALEGCGIDYQQATDTLERQGIDKFQKSWDELSRTVSRELRSVTT
jgi:transaldolase